MGLFVRVCSAKEPNISGHLYICWFLRHLRIQGAGDSKFETVGRNDWLQQNAKGRWSVRFQEMRKISSPDL